MSALSSTAIPTSAQMIIDIKDISVVKDLKHILARINGIGKISVKKNYYESKEFYHDIAVAESDIANGKGICVDSKDALDALFV